MHDNFADTKAEAKTIALMENKSEKQLQLHRFIKAVAFINDL